MATSKRFQRADERVAQAERVLRSAKTILSDFTLRDQAVAEAEAELAAAILERDAARKADPRNA